MIPFQVTNLDAAKAIEDERELIKTTIENSGKCESIFVKTLLNPPEPDEALKAAAQRHKELGL